MQLGSGSMTYLLSVLLELYIQESPITYEQF